MFGMGWPELLLIFVAILLLFGAKRLPEIAQGLGKGIKEFRKAMKETTEDLKNSIDVESDDKTESGEKTKHNDEKKKS